MDTPLASHPAPDLHIKRPCLLVADLERSLQLYRDILGFRLDYVGEASAQSYLYQVFQLPAAAQLRFAALTSSQEERALALTEVKGIELPSPSPPFQSATVIQVAAVTPLLPTIDKLGLPILPPSHFTAPPNLSFTEQAIHDFDGHLLVLYDVVATHGLTDH
ncbi:MAG: VOC family protein [Cyanobacteria bacterium P01_A01_bin.105]